MGDACRELAARMGFDAMACKREQLDLCDSDGLARVLDENTFDLVVNAAAYTAVDRAEAEPALATAINGEAPGRLARLCHERTMPLIHFSTDYVFDGHKEGPYAEEDDIRPLSIYGASKAAGEAAVRAALPQHIILRTSWVFSARGCNFVTGMLRLGRERPALRIVADQLGGPTSAVALADAVGSIAARIQAGGEMPWGTYHLSGAPPTNWHDFAAAIFEDWAALTGARSPDLTAIVTADYPTAALRPANSVLDCGRILAAFDIAPSDWRQELRSVLQEIKKEGGP